MKVCLLNPPFKSEHGRFSREQRSPAITKGGTFYYPMWLCHAAGVLAQDGFAIRIIDAPAWRQSLAEVRAAVAAFAPALIVVNTSTPSIASDVAAAADLKEATGAFVVLVGTHPTALPEASLQIDPGVDAVARREYEYTVRELARKLRDGGGRCSRDVLATIEGLSFRRDGEIVHNADRPYIEDLDALPFVSRVYHDHLNVRNYFYTIAQYPQVALVTGRGCPHRCVYCVYPQVMHGHRFRKRSVENIIEEFRYIERELPEVREVFIEDDTFTIDRRRVAEFSDAYRRAGLKLSWIANSRADVELETLRALKACNCRLLCVGFESGEQRILDAMKKRLTVSQARQFVQDAKRAGILVHGCFLTGNPGETTETLETTLAFAKSLTPDTAQFFPLIVYPGTEAYAWAVRNGYLTTQDYARWNTPEGLHNCVVSRPGLSNTDLVAFCDRARREFYLRPGYLAYRLWRLLRHPVEDGPRMWKSMKVFRRFLVRGTHARRRRPSRQAEAVRLMNHRGHREHQDS